MGEVGAVTIQPTRFWPRVMLAFWLIEAVLGLMFAGMGLGWLGHEQPLLLAAVTAGGLILAFAGLVMAAVCWAAAWPGGPAIEMSPAGFRDRRIADRLIPWASMRWGIVATGRGVASLQFDVDPGLARQLQVRPGSRWTGRLNRLFGYPQFTVMPLGTGKPVQELADLMSGYAQPSF